MPVLSYCHIYIVIIMIQGSSTFSVGHWENQGQVSFRNPNRSLESRAHHFITCHLEIIHERNPFRFGVDLGYASKVQLIEFNFQIHVSSMGTRSPDTDGS